MDSKGENQLYKWELINNAWKVSPLYKETLRPQNLTKMAIEMKATSAGRVSTEKNHYE
jgi:hypothetical protein